MLDVGHHSLEEEMMRRMSQVLAAMFAGVEVIFVASSSPLRPRCAFGDAQTPVL